MQKLLILVSVQSVHAEIDRERHPAHYQEIEDLACGPGWSSEGPKLQKKVRRKLRKLASFPQGDVAPLGRALNCAAKHRNRKVVQALLTCAHCADVDPNVQMSGTLNGERYNDMTPVLWAAYHRHAKMVLELLTLKSGVNLQIASGDCSEDHIKHKTFFEIFESTWVMKSALLKYWLKHDLMKIEYVDKMLAHKAQLGDSEFLSTMVSVAAYRRKEKLVRALMKTPVRKVLDINQRNDAMLHGVRFEKMTPLMWAANFGDEGIVRALMKICTGCDPIDVTLESGVWSEKENSYMTALHFAYEGGHKKCTEVIWLVMVGLNSNNNNSDEIASLDWLIEMMEKIFALPHQIHHFLSAILKGDLKFLEEETLLKLYCTIARQMYDDRSYRAMQYKPKRDEILRRINNHFNREEGKIIKIIC